MDIVFDTETWFIFCILSLATLLCCVSLYIAIPYFTGRRQLVNIKNRQKKRVSKIERFEKTKQEKKISSLEYRVQNLQTDAKEYLHQLTQLGSAPSDLTTFFGNFEKAYPNFTKTLQRRIPDISANELKLCALLRLNLSSKEIAQLLNINPESVNKARYRIRKKMGLSREQDLSSILISI
jgi:DNA-binding CsgD family transcriptional regulator